GCGVDGAASGTGLSIVRALVADELQGSFVFAGARAAAVFPACASGRRGRSTSAAATSSPSRIARPRPAPTGTRSHALSSRARRLAPESAVTELWHVSEEPTIEVFHPHHRELHALDEPLVWAVDAQHWWLYWFPRDCPRACFNANADTTDEDVERWLDGDRQRRVAVIEA